MGGGLARLSGGHGLPCILVIGEAALAADLSMGLIFKHLEQNLAPCCHVCRRWTQQALAVIKSAASAAFPEGVFEP